MTTIITTYVYDKDILSNLTEEDKEKAIIKYGSLDAYWDALQIEIARLVKEKSPPSPPLPEWCRPSRP